MGFQIIVVISGHLQDIFFELHKNQINIFSNGWTQRSLICSVLQWNLRQCVYLRNEKINEIKKTFDSLSNSTNRNGNLKIVKINFDGRLQENSKHINYFHPTEFKFCYFIRLRLFKNRNLFTIFESTELKLVSEMWWGWKRKSDGHFSHFNEFFFSSSSEKIDGSHINYANKMNKHNKNL